MHFSPALIPGTLIQRYKRFLADVRLADGSVITAHCPNSGAMLGLKEPGIRVWVTPQEPSPTRKLNYRLEMVEADGVLVGVNTHRGNELVDEALKNGVIAELAAYTSVRREVKYGVNSRIDFLLEGEGLPPCYVEVKTAHLKYEGALSFPDAVTERGAKHLRELSAQVKLGARAVVIYAAQRRDATYFRLADGIDPVYAQEAARAKLAGVEFLCYIPEISEQHITLTHTLPIRETL